MRAARFLILLALANAFAGELEEVPALPPDFRDARQPTLACGPAGTVVMAFGVQEKGQVWICSLPPGERAFSKPALVATTPKLALGNRRGPRIAATGKALAVSFVDDGDLVCHRSTDGGKSWSGPVRVNAGERSAMEGMHAMAATPSGDLLLVWMDRNGRKRQEMGQDVMFARSKDGGKTFSKPARINDATTCPCCSPNVAAGPDGKVAAMWRNDLLGCRDLYVSLLEGGDFGQEAKQGTGTWEIRNCPVDGGGLALDAKGRPWSAWRREGTVYASTPDDPELKLGPGKTPAIAIGPGGSLALWTHKDAIYLKDLGEKGEATRLSDPPKGVRQDSPSLVSLPGGGWIAAWEERAPDGKPTIRAVRIP